MGRSERPRADHDTHSKEGPNEDHDYSWLPVPDSGVAQIAGRSPIFDVPKWNGAGPFGSREHSPACHADKFPTAANPNQTRFEMKE
jgi:hypothetical protein